MNSLPVSVVIICRNAGATIKKAVLSARLITDDVVVADNGSTDDTPAVAAAAGARLIHLSWQGYGETKNRGNEAAGNNWIFSLDADEEISTALAAAIKNVKAPAGNVVYSVKRLNYLGSQPIYHGEWQNDWTARLFNKTMVKWNAAPVHENLLLPPAAVVKKLEGVLHHYTAQNIESYAGKMDAYARLMAGRYYAGGKKAPGVKMIFSPLFSFVKYYLVQGGWMDKAAGLKIALVHARYTYKKYKGVKELAKKT